MAILANKATKFYTCFRGRRLSKLDLAREEISQELQSKSTEGVPETADSYKFTPSSDVVPEGVEFNLDVNNPQYKQFPNENIPIFFREGLGNLIVV